MVRDKLGGPVAAHTYCSRTGVAIKTIRVVEGDVEVRAYIYATFVRQIGEIWEPMCARQKCMRRTVSRTGQPHE